MIEWVGAVVQGTLLGGLYALFAAGLSLIFGVMRLVNIAHGDLIILSAYIGLSTTMLLGVHPFAALIVVVPAMAGFGYALQRGLLNRTLGQDILPPASGHVRAFGHHSECLAGGLYGRSPQAARRSRGNGQCNGRRNRGWRPALADLRDCRRRDRQPAMDLLPNKPGPPSSGPCPTTRTLPS